MIHTAARIALLAAVGLLPYLNAQQPQAQRRDLVIDKDPTIPTDSPPGIPRSYALVIGVSRYRNLPEKSQLKYAEADAELIYSTLISPEGGNFPADHVHKLLGPRATLAAMRHELEEWLPSQAKEDDRVLVYFAGHGFKPEGRGYLAPYDFVLTTPETTGYPMDTLGRVMGRTIQGKWKVLLTDACHSGAILPETNPEGVNRELHALGSSLLSLTASRDAEVAFESPDIGGGHGLFSYYVAQGIKGEADVNGDGKVTADELAEYVHRLVREKSGGKQNPTSERGSFLDDMLLGYNPSGVKHAAPAPEFGTLVFESNMDEVELFVDNDSKGVLKKGQRFSTSGLKPGLHTIKAVHMGYEPDGPREEIVYPGQETTVRIQITILRRRPRAAADAFDKGVKAYTDGGEKNYRQAAEQFRKALDIDPKYSAAALYLGRTRNALFEQDAAEAAFRKAIDIDPDYTEARSSFAGMLLDKGGIDEAIRQLTAALQRKPDDAQSLYLIAEAYRMRAAYPQSIEAARKAIGLAPRNAEAHFWLAESLRMSQQYDSAKPEYDRYLRLSNFDSGLAGQVNYYVLGYLVGLGHKTRASQRDIWSDLRSLAYFGLCDCDLRLKQYDSAIAYCQRALSYDSKDPYTHYALGLSYAHKAKDSGSLETLAAASQHFRSMLELNPDMSEAPAVKKMLKGFEEQLARP